MKGLFSVLSELSVVAAPVIARVAAGTLTESGPWRPPEWSAPALTAVTVPATASAPATTSTVDTQFGAAPGAPAYPGTPAEVYVFDAVLRAEHRRELRRTEHPIQASAAAPVTSISDHAFLVPARVTLEIGMSDAMASFTRGQWSDKGSKSISAYQTLLALQQGRTLVTLTTRLDTYTNMVIESIAAPDDVKTRHGLRATVVFGQVFLASATGVSSAISFGDPSAVSARPQTTDSTPSGLVQARPVPNGIAEQNNVTSSAAAKLTLAKAPAVPGAGVWSSVSVSRLKGLLG